jgi:nitroimidazol reductase NimA-like FMN-containing flavoprotein (pyridoxamine 5'-phosphate oxidase superfamily)
VPLSFVREGGSIYFHSANAGHKLAAIAHSDKSSFCVISEDDVVPGKLTTRYRSVIVFGRIRVLADDERKRHGLRLLAGKYSPDHLAEAEADIERDWNRVCVLELGIEEMTGKAGLEIIREREQGRP